LQCVGQFLDGGTAVTAPPAETDAEVGEMMGMKQKVRAVLNLLRRCVVVEGETHHGVAHAEVQRGVGYTLQSHIGGDAELHAFSALHSMADGIAHQRHHLLDVAHVFRKVQPAAAKHDSLVHVLEV